MLFQRVNRTDAEKVFVIVYNASGGAFTVGQAVCGTPARRLTAFASPLPLRLRSARLLGCAGGDCQRRLRSGSGLRVQRLRIREA